MSWFLFGPRKKKSARRKRSGSAPKAWDPAFTYRAVRGMLCAAVAVGLTAGWVLAQDPLRKAIGQSHKVVPRVQLVNAPAWMPPAVADELHQIVSSRVTDDPFDRDSLLEAARQLGQSPWVHRVLRVVRRPDGLVEVSAEYRQRIALVKTASGYHLIDRQRVRLPFSYQTSEARHAGLPLIHGVERPMPPAGQPWPGDDLAAGLKLAACIAGQPWAAQVQAVDVSNYSGRADNRRGHLKLLTGLDADDDPSNNPGIEWGRPPGQEQPYEPEPAWKLRHIALEVSKHGPLTDRIVKVTQEPGLTRRLGDAQAFVSATERREDQE